MTNPESCPRYSIVKLYKYCRYAMAVVCGTMVYFHARTWREGLYLIVFSVPVSFAGACAGTEAWIEMEKP